MLSAATTLVSRINRLFLLLAAAITVLLALFMTVVVVRRYAFNAPIGWALDFSRAAFAYIVFLGIAPTLQDRNHVAVDLIYERVSERIQRWLTTIAWVMVVAYAALLLWKLGDHTLAAFESGRLFHGSWQVQAKYVYVIAPIGVLQFLITAVLEFARHLRGLPEVRLTRPHEPQPRVDEA